MFKYLNFISGIQYLTMGLVSVLCFLGMISCSSKVEKIDSTLNNKPLEVILDWKGEPINEKILELGLDSLYEYQYNLYNIFPNYKKEKVVIKELCWNKSSLKTVLWFYKKDGKKWISVDNLTWDTLKISY